MSGDLNLRIIPFVGSCSAAGTDSVQFDCCDCSLANVATCSFDILGIWKMTVQCLPTSVTKWECPTIGSNFRSIYCDT